MRIENSDHCQGRISFAQDMHGRSPIRICDLRPCRHSLLFCVRKNCAYSVLHDSGERMSALCCGYALQVAPEAVVAAARLASTTEALVYVPWLVANGYPSTKTAAVSATDTGDATNDGKTVLSPMLLCCTHLTRSASETFHGTTISIAFRCRGQEGGRSPHGN